MIPKFLQILGLWVFLINKKRFSIIGQNNFRNKIPITYVLNVDIKINQIEGLAEPFWVPHDDTPQPKSC